MSETKPRDLTAEEMARVQAPATRRTDTAPLRIPPGSQTAIELLDPAAAVEATATAAPTAGPNEAVCSEGSVTSAVVSTGRSLKKR